MSSLIRTSYYWEIMNNLESMKSTLEAIRNDISDSAENLNSVLSTVGVRKVDCKNAILKIEKQIASADNKFTIAFVGTFKTGKSTIINSLLDLQGEMRLSSEDDPDTARCIRIVERNGRDYEAEVDFGGAYPTERLSWNEAKKYTSQVALDLENENFQKKASKINEVRYYIDSPLLRLCNILDLPGTGTGSHDDHTAVTDEKIMESDCFFLVLSTDIEPDLETIKNLKKIKHKLLPIINVWQYEDEGIQGDYEPEEIIEMLNSEYSEHLVNAYEPLIYYAKEIDVAQQKGYPLNDIWGKQKFIEKVQEIISNVQTGDRAGRIKKNLTDALSECRTLVDSVKDNTKIKELESIADKDKTEIKKKNQKLERCNSLVRSDIMDTAKKKTDEILDILAKASENFIQSKMSGVDLKYFPRMFTGKQKKEMTKGFEEEFKKNYLRLESGWMDDLVKAYRDEIFVILKGKYVDFASSLDEENFQNTTDFKLEDMTGFVDTISEQIQKDFQSKSITFLSSAVVMIILCAIPGGVLLDSFAAIFSLGKGVSGFGNDEKLKSKINMVIVQSKCQIRQQKYTIVNALKTQGEEVSNDFYRSVRERFLQEKDKITKEVEKLNKVKQVADEFENVIERAEDEVNILI